MIIKLRVRSNKLDVEKTNIPIMNNEFVLFDNCSLVKFGRRTEVSKNTFVNYIARVYTNKVQEEFERNVVSHEVYAKYMDTQKGMNGKLFDKYHVMLKDAHICDPEEVYHYNVIEWIDRVDNKTHRLLYDTVVFIQDDTGKTIEKVLG